MARNTSVVRAGLRLLEEREAKQDTLRAALIEGEQSGPPTPFDFDAFIERRAKAARRLINELELSPGVCAG